MRFIKGRDDLAVTIFVPWDCQNNCKFCTSKKEYSMCTLDMEKTKESIRKLNSLGYDKFVFTGGEPFADLNRLKELMELIDEDKTVYINTTLPTLNGIDNVDYINDEKRIKGISVSRHSENTVQLKNIFSDAILHLIHKPIRINSLIDENLDYKDMIDRYSKFEGVTLNLRVDYRYTTKFSLRQIEGIGEELFFDTDYTLVYSGGCNVCHNFEFVRLSDGFRVQYHKGLEQSSFKVEDTIFYNDIIVKPNGSIYYDWDNKIVHIEELLK